jgi:hypothetical protein
MTAKTSFNTDEWNLLRSAAPFLAAGVGAADPSGLIGSLKEAMGGMGAMADSLKQGSNLELMKDMLADKSMPGMPDPKTMMGEGSREEQLGTFRKSALARAREAVDLVQRKGSPEEVAAYRGMLLAVADRAANAAKEGGFFGFGGERVSAPEKTFLDELRGAIGKS